MSDIDLPTLPQAAANMANEGIPIAAIARVLYLPFAEVNTILHEAITGGYITEFPRADWPPGQLRTARVPTVSIKTSDQEVEFVCCKVFKLTRLEAGFVVRLLKLDHCDKEKLHHVIETQRLQRSSNPDSMEATDQKMVDVIICKLRKKLKDLDPEFKITTVWGGGYYIELPVKEKIYARLAAEGVRRAGASVQSPDVHQGNSLSAGS